MDSYNLKDFKPGDPDFDSKEDSFANSEHEIPSSVHHEEINTLKIDKLSNRVTIISIIIPCLISAVLIFAYLDMKERVVDVDQTKQSQVDRISQQLEEKLNALDVKIAKNRFELDNKLPEIEKKNVTLEGQLTKLIDTKADAKTIKTRFTKLEKRVGNNTNQDKTNLQTIERINKQILSTIKDNQNKYDKTAQQLKDDIRLFKEEFDTRLLELSDYELRIGEIAKDVSLLDKKFKSLEQDMVSKTVFDEKLQLIKTDIAGQIKTIDQEVKKLNKKLTANLSRFQKNLDSLSKVSSSSESTQTKPSPQINIDSTGSVEIKEESLTQ